MVSRTLGTFRWRIVTQRIVRYNCHMDTKLATSIRLTPEAKRLMAALAKKLGVSLTAILEIAIREKAKAEGIK